MRVWGGWGSIGGGLDIIQHTLLDIVARESHGRLLMAVLLLGHWVPGASGKIPLLSKQSLDSLY